MSNQSSIRSGMIVGLKKGVSTIKDYPKRWRVTKVRGVFEEGLPAAWIEGESEKYYVKWCVPKAALKAVAI